MPREAIVYRRSIGAPPNRLERQVEPIPSPLPPTSILVRVHAVTLNYRDCNILNGTNPWPVLEHGIPCSDAAGEVVAVGSHAVRFALGARVCPIVDRKSFTGEEQERQWAGGEIDGVLASHLVLDEQLCISIPDHLNWVEAACLPNAGLTAWSSLVTEGRRLVSGQTILLQGTGGVSMMALKLSLAAGCRVIVTSSSDQKLDQIRKMTDQDLIHTINYATSPDWDREVLSANGGVGVDIVLENGGTSSILRSVRAVKKGGIVSQVGYLGQQDIAHLSGLIPLLIDKTVDWRGINVGSRQDFERLNKLVASAQLHFEDVVDKRFLFEQATEAFA